MDMFSTIPLYVFSKFNCFVILIIHKLINEQEYLKKNLYDYNCLVEM